MEYKFKFGDKVEILSGAFTGCTGTVIGIDPHDDDIPYIVDVGRRNAYKKEECMELIKPEPFKIGDIVRVRKDCTIEELAEDDWHDCGLYSLCESEGDDIADCGQISLSREFAVEDVDVDRDVLVNGLWRNWKVFELVRHAPEPKKMTMKQLEEALGYPVKIVGQNEEDL